MHSMYKVSSQRQVEVLVVQVSKLFVELPRLEIKHWQLNAFSLLEGQGTPWLLKDKFLVLLGKSEALNAEGVWRLSES